MAVGGEASSSAVAFGSIGYGRMAELHAKTALGTMRIHATMDATPPEDQAPGPKQFSRGQRRVLGTLLEKAFTTPDVYPLTLKACTTACKITEIP